MKIYEYEDPTGQYMITETEILTLYFDEWSKRMVKADKSSRISEQNCIDDFILDNWAWEIKDGDV